MVLNKGLTYLLLSVITLLPWNATAVNSYSLSNLLPKPEMRALTGIAENLLVKSLLEITQGKNQQALRTIDELIQKIPNFKLAYLVRGDLLMAQAQHLQSFGNDNVKQADAVRDLQAEARVRIERYLSNENLDKLPDLLMMPNDQQSHLIVVDTSKSRLYVYKNTDGQLNYVADYYVTVGKNGVGKKIEGDKRTPIGVYFARAKLTQPLADMYGNGAYPLNYPNEWDKQQKRSGSGIWIHGTPSNTYSRPPNASDGCVVLTNQDLNAIAPILQKGNTPVIIADNLKWIDAYNKSADKEALKDAMAHWLVDWKSQNTAEYLSHYSRSFSSDGINFEQWSDHKFKVQASKPVVEINVSNISMFAYPNPDNKLVIVEFTQDFKSPTLTNKMQKRQYWIREGNTWKIIYEGSA